MIRPHSLFVTMVLGLIISVAVMGFGPYPRLPQALGGRAPLEEAPAASIEEAQTIVDALGVGGRALYARNLRLDVLFIFANTLMFAVMLCFALERLRVPGARRIALLALVPAAIDVTENIALWGWIVRGNVTAGWVRTSAIATQAKLATFGGLLLIVVLALATLAIVSLVRWVRRRGAAPPAAPPSG